MNAQLKSRLKKLFLALGYSVTKARPPDHSVYFSLENFLYQFLARKGEIFFIQIGANDGITNDPLYNFVTQTGVRVKGILLEPLKDAFKLLTENYKKFPGIVTVNAAIHNTQKEMILYKVDKDRLAKLPPWADLRASFNKDHHKITSTPSEYIVTESVRCLSLDELLNTYHVNHIDLLCIDTEGYDAEIITNIDFKRMAPSIIHFEHGLVDGIMTPETFMATVRRLNENGYQVIIESYDATAYRPEILMDKVGRKSKEEKP